MLVACNGASAALPSGDLMPQYSTRSLIAAYRDHGPEPEPQPTPEPQRLASARHSANATFHFVRHSEALSFILALEALMVSLCRHLLLWEVSLFGDQRSILSRKLRSGKGN